MQSMCPISLSVPAHPSLPQPHTPLSYSAFKKRTCTVWEPFHPKCPRLLIFGDVNTNLTRPRESVLSFSPNKPSCSCATLLQAPCMSESLKPNGIQIQNLNTHLEHNLFIQILSHSSPPYAPKQSRMPGL